VEGASNESVVVENGYFHFIHSLSSEHFTYMATRQLSGDATVSDLGHISRSLDCFTLGVVGVVGVIVADDTNFEGPNVPNFIEKPPFFFVSEQSRLSTLSVQKV